MRSAFRPPCRTSCSQWRAVLEAPRHGGAQRVGLPVLRIVHRRGHDRRDTLGHQHLRGVQVIEVVPAFPQIRRGRRRHDAARHRAFVELQRLRQTNSLPICPSSPGTGAWAEVVPGRDVLRTGEHAGVQRVALLRVDVEPEAVARPQDELLEFKPSPQWRLRRTGRRRLGGGRAATVQQEASSRTAETRTRRMGGKPDSRQGVRGWSRQRPRAEAIDTGAARFTHPSGVLLWYSGRA